MEVFDAEMFGTVVAGRRDELGWTQAHLAEVAGLSRSWGSRVESGRIDLRLSTLLALLGALDLRLSVTGAPPRRRLGQATDGQPAPGPPADATILDDVITRAAAPADRTA